MKPFTVALLAWAAFACSASCERVFELLYGSGGLSGNRERLSKR